MVTNPYIPAMAEITAVERLTEREKMFSVRLEQPLHHRPGQFAMLSLPGIGECAISITNGPEQDQDVDFVIRKAGNVTGVLHELGPGDAIGVRGPFGSGFNLDELRGRDLLIIAGGLGLAPLRSLIIPVMENKQDYGHVSLIIGSRTPAETLFRDQIAAWREKPDTRITELVDNTGFQPWDGETGLVTEPLGKLELDESNTRVILCGPPVMYKFVLLELSMYFRIAAEHVYLDLERRMRCGIGKCGHCQINHVYCCKSGPVFRYSELSGLPEALT